MFYNEIDVLPGFLPISASMTSHKQCLKYNTGPGCSKLTISLVNISLKVQTLLSKIFQYFLSKKFEKLLQCKSFSNFFNKKFQCIWI